MAYKVKILSKHNGEDREIILTRKKAIMNNRACLLNPWLSAPGLYLIHGYFNAGKTLVSRGDTHNNQVETLETLKKQCLQAKTGVNTSNEDIGDIGDEFSKENKKTNDQEFEDLGAGCSDCDEEDL